MEGIIMHSGQRWPGNLAVLLAAILVLAGCGPTAAQDEAAIQVVRDFVAAWEAGDTSAVLALVEPADWRREMGPELRAYTGRIDQLQLANAAYSLLDNDGQVARVRLTGSLSYTLHDGVSGEHELDAVVEVVQVEGAWYVRGLDVFEMLQP